MNRARPYVHWVPVALLAVALLTMPYGYYTFLRLCIFGTAVLVAVGRYRSKNSVDGWVASFTLIAILYNPFIRIHLERDWWAGINLVTATIYVVSFFRQSRTFV